MPIHVMNQATRRYSPVGMPSVEEVWACSVEIEFVKASVRLPMARHASGALFGQRVAFRATKGEPFEENGVVYTSSLYEHVNQSAVIVTGARVRFACEPEAFVDEGDARVAGVRRPNLLDFGGPTWRAAYDIAQIYELHVALSHRQRIVYQRVRDIARFEPLANPEDVGGQMVIARDVDGLNRRLAELAVADPEHPTDFRASRSLASRMVPKKKEEKLVQAPIAPEISMPPLSFRPMLLREGTLITFELDILPGEEQRLEDLNRKVRVYTPAPPSEFGIIPAGILSIEVDLIGVEIGSYSTSLHRWAEQFLPRPEY